MDPLYDQLDLFPDFYQCDASRRARDAVRRTAKLRKERKMKWLIENLGKRRVLVPLTAAVAAGAEAAAHPVADAVAEVVLVLVRLFGS
jgi:hypothetical protein